MYKKIIEQIHQFNFKTFSDAALMERSVLLKKQRAEGLEILLPEAFALVAEAAIRTLGLKPYDTQLMAGITMHQGKLAEMQTGEGKTLAAVFPAYLNALSGKGVHIMTFNDYLACRDAQWMGEIYAFLGLSVGCVTEDMGMDERKSAYNADITYLTAREAGFDYLRDFLCCRKEELLHRPFHFALIDEADSILIDEARVPLVIAGRLPDQEKAEVRMAELVRTLKHGTDYEIDQHGLNVYLTDRGLGCVENLLGCGSLYEERNLEPLTSFNSALHAEVLLHRDKDYIVRDGRIELVDAFTGRVAAQRHWPDNLHRAVEIKEGLRSGVRGRIMGSIALQFFLGLYPKIAGMTGTARTSAAEFETLYGLQVVEIPTYKPSIRKDHPDTIFTHEMAKWAAIVKEIQRAHGNGQPVLVGTGSIEESERLAIDLHTTGVSCKVLNAKNDEMEAGVIERAGELGAVTVSTNMAGRGVDIKLGEGAAKAGGLYVIGTQHYESRRIDNQLRGRAGRQGDPGETRFFISFEDALVRNYDMMRLIPQQHMPTAQAYAIEDPVVVKALESGQRWVEGYNQDVRQQLWKYAYMMEQQRRIIHEKRHQILMEKTQPGFLKERCKKRYDELSRRFGETPTLKAERQLTLHFLNKGWMDYQEHMAYVKEGIHLVAISGKDPLVEYWKQAIESFNSMQKAVEGNMIEAFQRIEMTSDGINMDKEGLQGPSSTWTYLVNDSPMQFSNVPFLTKAASNYISRPLFTLRSMLARLIKG